MASTDQTQKPALVLTDFLRGPAPSPSKRQIDFSKTELTGYDGLYAVLLDGVLSTEECVSFVALAEQNAPKGWERAMVNIGNGRQMMIEDTRKCGRIIFDDQDMVDRLWARVRDLLPELVELKDQPDVTGTRAVTRKQIWRMTRLNERMRFLKYTAGEYFKPHCDGMYVTPDERERTYYTLHLYLNDADSQPDTEPLVGGATTFWSYDSFEPRRLDVEPKTGSILIFQQRHLVHAGDDLISGTKITMRTELMYERADSMVGANSDRK